MCVVIEYHAMSALPSARSVGRQVRMPVKLDFVCGPLRSILPPLATKK